MAEPRSKYKNKLNMIKPNQEEENKLEEVIIEFEERKKS